MVGKFFRPKRVFYYAFNNMGDAEYALTKEQKSLLSAFNATDDILEFVEKYLR